MKKRNNKGFTLAELLVVIAIIAILVAIAVPVFSAQLEKAREGVDRSDARAAQEIAYAEYMLNHMGGNGDAGAEKIVYTFKRDDKGNLEIAYHTTIIDATCEFNTATTVEDKNQVKAKSKNAGTDALSVEITSGRVTANNWLDNLNKSGSTSTVSGS